MACTNPDGSLTASAAAILGALKSRATPEQIAAATGLPLFRVRSGLRDMVAAGIVSVQEGTYEAVQSGQ